MTFEELGLTLRTEREKRGHMVEDVASRLKISARVIRALEEGDANALPHNVYLRGFVRSYASYLGFNEDELRAAMEALGDEELELPVHPIYASPEIEEKSVTNRLVPIIILALCLAGGVFYWLYAETDLFSSTAQMRVVTAQPAPGKTSAAALATAQKNPTTPVDSSAQLTADSTRQIVPSSSSTQAAPAAGTNSTTGPAPSTAQVIPQTVQLLQNKTNATVPVTMTAPNASTAAQQTVQSPASNSTANRQPLPSGQHKVILTALAECWVHSNADGADTRQFALRKGDTFALTFSDKLVLKLGNAGGVRLRYDGEDLPVSGKEGQVKTLTFPPVE